MGRLFWKVFLAFWLALLLAGGGVGTVVWLRHLALQQETDGIDLRGRAARWVGTSEAVLRHGGVAALRRLLDEWERSPAPQVLAVDENGRDLLARPVPPELLARARTMVREGDFPARVRRVAADDGHAYLLFMPGPERDGEAPPPAFSGPGRGFGHGRPPPSPALPIVSGVIASLLFSAWLAWYLAKPIRNLRSAFSALAAGRMETRVAPSMGRRRDEMADLGREFDHMAGQIKSLMDAQQRLLHDVSHELRSPLARLQVAIGLARQKPDRADATLERIEREALRLDELVGELLTLSRLEAGVTGAMAEEIDLDELLQGILEDARFEAEAKGVRLQAVTGGGTLQGGWELLHRAIENVLRNALKHTPAGGCVAIESRLDARGGRLHLAVADQGHGVGEGELDAIFQPFYRGGGAGKGGFGLGLAIARRAVEAYGGTIRAVNQPAGGLRVEIVLPLEKGR